MDCSCKAISASIGVMDDPGPSLSVTFPSNGPLGGRNPRLFIDGYIRTVPNRLRTTGIIVAIVIVAVIHFICFYGLSAGNWFGGDALWFFSHQIRSFKDVAHRFLSLDELFEYRPLSFVVFSFVLHPLLGVNPSLYHAVAYALTLLDTLLACTVVYLWTGKRTAILAAAAIFLLLNPVNFDLSFGVEFLSEQLMALFYFSALICIIKEPGGGIIASVLFGLALCSKLQTAVLPAHATVILLSSGTQWRAAFRRTRWLWYVLAGCLLFQLAIRGGRMFPTEAESSRLHFEVSLDKLRDLANGTQIQLYFPQGNFEAPYNIRRLIRIGLLLPWVAAFAIAVRRKDWLALSGVLSAGLSLAPVAFIAERPVAHQYYLALPGAAILFASILRKRPTALVAVAPILAVILIHNATWYSTHAWPVQSSVRAKRYVSTIESIANRTGATEFYLTDKSDPDFLFQIGNGIPLAELLGRPLSFQIGVPGRPLPMARILANQVQVITGIDGNVVNAFLPGPGSLFEDGSTCRPVRQLFGGSGTCAVFSNGVQPTKSPDQAISSSAGKIVTRSPSTVMIETSRSLRFQRRATVSPQSDGAVGAKVYLENSGSFRLVQSLVVSPGGSLDVNIEIDPATATAAVLRTESGLSSNQGGELLIWNEPPRTNVGIKKAGQATHR
jgi:hypothetical protein